MSAPKATDDGTLLTIRSPAPPCRRSSKRRSRKNPRASDFFANLDRVNRYAIIWRIQTAKKPETRARRVATLVGMLEKGEKLH
ncbi:MAG TPA: YdeI/OmpD-associated family protein [Gemmatimonadaceae bacterium]|nr:YdeI/OmpD-associated family protein [Gemmatimonadaceae bacterium]